MEQLEQLERKHTTKFILANAKKDKANMLVDEFFRTFSIVSLGGDKRESVYYDTKDYFFREKGISIHFSSGKGIASKFLISYDSSAVQRVEFLKNMPSYYKIATNDSNPKSHIECINQAVLTIFPSGFGTDVDEKIKELVPVLRLNKVCDRYRVINNRGVKVKFSFNNTIASDLVAGGKAKFDTLEIESDTNVDFGVYKDFEKAILLQFPTMLKISSNEMTAATELIKG